jgi:dolichol-phosphate mannosyltransferase
MRRLSSLDLPLDTGDFRLMDRRVVDAFRQFSESQRFVRGIVTWMGFRQTAVQYERPARHAGSGKYSLVQLLKLAMDAIVGFSIMPLRLATTVGLICVAASLLGGAFSLGRSWLGKIDPGSTTNLLLGFLLLGGIQLLSIGILGEYVGRVHRDVLRRPLYLVDRCHGWENKISDTRRGGMSAHALQVPRDASLHSRQPAA